MIEPSVHELGPAGDGRGEACVSSPLAGALAPDGEEGLASALGDAGADRTVSGRLEVSLLTARSSQA